MRINQCTSLRWWRISSRSLL